MPWIAAVLACGCGRVGTEEPEPIDSDNMDATADAREAEGPDVRMDVALDVVDPPPTGDCVSLTELPAIPPHPTRGGLSDFARVMYVRDGSLFVMQLRGVLASWAPPSGPWVLVDGLYSPRTPGAAEWAADFGDVSAIGSVREIPVPGADPMPRLPVMSQYWLPSGSSTWAQSSTPVGAGFNSGPLNLPTLMYPKAMKERAAAVQDDGTADPWEIEVGKLSTATRLGKIAGWLPTGATRFIRFAPAGRYHVRSGRSTTVAVLDLDALTMRAVKGVEAIDGFGAVAVESATTRLWLYGKTASSPARLFRIDPATATGESFDAAGLAAAATPNASQDLLVADGDTVWKLRFAEGTAVVSSLDPSTGKARVHALAGATDVAKALFLPGTADLSATTDTSPNGFSPPESLHALRLGPGDLVVARQYGPFAAVRMQLGGCK